MSQGEFIARLLAAWGGALGELGALLGDDDALRFLTGALGEVVPTDADLSPVTQALGPLPKDLVTLTSAASALDPTGDISQLASEVEEVVSAVAAVLNDVHHLATNAPPVGLPAPFSDATFWARFLEDAIGFLAYEQLRHAAPRLLAALELLGGTEALVLDASGTLPVTRRLAWERLAAIVTDPATQVRQTYGWGATFNSATLLDAFRRIAAAAGIPTASGTADDPALDAYWGAPTNTSTDPRRGPLVPIRTTLYSTYIETPAGTLDSLEVVVGVIPIPAASTTGAPVGIALYLEASDTAPAVITLSPTWTLTLDVSAALDGGFRAELRPTGVTFTVPTSVTGKASLAVTATATPSTPFVIGDPDSTRVEIPSVAFGVTATVTEAGGTTGGDLVLAGSGSLNAFIDLSAAGGFLTELLGGATHSAAFTGAIEWSHATGLRLSGGIGPKSGAPGSLLSAQLPVNLDLGGVLTVDTITLESAPATGGADIGVLLTGALSLGPATATIDRMGMRASLRLPAGGEPPGNLGPIDLDLGFAAPSGVGLALDSSLVVGGGYLDQLAGGSGYSGALQLTIAGIGVAGVGELVTQLPGGQPGFSLIIAMFATLPPLEVGFGFAITGLGGTVGIHRAVDTQALTSVMQAGGLDALLFPSDLVSNATTVLGDLEQVFPSAPGQYVVGPSVQIIWGEGGILTASLAILIELPSPVRVVVLARAVVALPSADDPLVEIELDIVGSIDFTAKQIALDAELRNSHILSFVLTGSAALRASWGDQPSFLLAVGGFNPRFQPPATFPTLQPLALALSNASNPQLRASSYLAITSNTVQFGGALQLHASVDVFLVGTFAIDAYLTVDTLIVLHPLSFVLDISAGVALTWNGNPVLAIALSGSLSGPSPWHADGRASFHICGVSASIRFSITIGPSQPLPAAPTVDLVSELHSRLADPANWLSSPPTTLGTVVLTCPPPADGQLVVHPLATVTVRQRYAPLSTAVDKVGDAKITGTNSLAVTGAQVAGAAATVTTVDDYFARGQFFTLGASNQLTAPSFDLMPAGVTVNADTTQLPTLGGSIISTTQVAKFTTIVPPPLGQPPSTTPLAVGTLPDTQLAQQLASVAATRPPTGSDPAAAGAAAHQAASMAAGLAGPQARYTPAATATASVQPTNYVVADAGLNLLTPPRRPAPVAAHLSAGGVTPASALASPLVGTFTASDALRQAMADPAAQTVPIAEAAQAPPSPTPPLRLGLVRYRGAGEPGTGGPGRVR